MFLKILSVISLVLVLTACGVKEEKPNLPLYEPTTNIIATGLGESC